MRTPLTLFFVGILLAGCGDDPPAGIQDLAMTRDQAMAGGDQAYFSLCGHEGDLGNSLGVGKFCRTISDCAGKTASICSTIQPQRMTYFCTMACTKTEDCGEGASCVLDPGLGASGCVPSSCIPTDGGP